MRLTQFKTYTLPAYNKRDLLGQGNSAGALLDLPGGGAYDAYGTDQAPEDVLEVSSTFEIIETTASAVQTQYDLIRALRGNVGKLWARMPYLTDRWVTARLARMRMERRREYIYYQPLELAWQIAQPGWNGQAHGAGWILDDGEVFDDGLYLDMGGAYVVTLTNGALATTNATIANNGNRTVTDVTITVTAVGDQITSVRFACSPCDWSYSGTIAAGTSLVVDCGAKSVLNDGTDDYANFQLNPQPSGVQASANWCEFAPGNNAVTMTTSSNAATNTVTFSFWDGWE